MTSTPGPAQGRNAVLDRLGDELADLGHRVESIRGDLRALRDESAPAAVPWRPPRPPAAPGPFPPPFPPPLPPAQQPPRPHRPHPAQPPRPPSRPDARAAAGPGWFTGPGALARLLGVAGAVVTLLGVVLLLVLAANRGWFGPGARVVGGGVFGLALVGAGLRVARRVRTAAGSSPTAGADTGAVALVATGVAALYLDVAAAAALYAFVPVPVALVLALLVVGAGLALADRWRHRGLALGVHLGGAALVPLVVGVPTPLMVGFLLVAQAAALPVVLRRGWPLLGVVAAAASALGALAAVAREVLVGTAPVAVTVVVVLVALAAVATALLDAARTAAPAGARAALVLVLGLPSVLVLAAHLPRAGGATLALAVALGLAVLALLVDHAVLPATLRPQVPGPLAVAAGASSAVVMLEGVLVALRGTAQGATVLGVAVVLALVARSTARRGVLLAGAALGAVGVLLALGRDLPLGLLVGLDAPRSTGALLGAALVGMLVLALAVALLAAWSRTAGGPGSDRAPGGLGLAGLGVLGLYGAAGLVVALALAVAPTRTGFLVGHVVVTISWTAVALVLLVRGVRRALPRVLGGALVVAALAKLVLFDLTALDGLARVAAFLGAGIVLLVAGTRYARLVAAS